MTIDATHTNGRSLEMEAPGSRLRAPGPLAFRPDATLKRSFGGPQCPGPEISSDLRPGARSPEPGAHTSVLRFLTCGSVDDGKSTLIGRLLYDSRAILADALHALARTSERRGLGTLDLSLLTDGLSAEREQGITIDVAYRYFTTGTRKYILADAPGHEQYTRNMVTAASTADLAILLVDARKGLQTQTRRHASIASLLGIRHLVVAVNKMDLVGWSESIFQGIRDEFGAFARELDLGDVRFLPLSALEGDMVVDRGERLGWYGGPTLMELLEAAEVAEGRAERPFRFPVQLVLRGPDFRGYAGRVESGEVGVGDTVTVLPSGHSSRVKGLWLGTEPLARAVAGQSLTLELEADLDLGRGDLLASPEAPPRVGRQVEADLCWLSEGPLAPSRRLLLKHTTRETRAVVETLEDRLDLERSERRPTAELRLNDIARATLSLHQPLAADPYASDRATGAFILIDEATHATVAAGLIRAIA